MFKKILIANRGEIAVRVIRACQEMEIHAIAVFSEADALSLHVTLADESHCIGAPPSAKSYLVIDNIIEVAKSSGAEAIHPGYGFLAESAEFARAVEAAGLVFIGPSALTIEQAGDKINAKRLMRQAGIPLIPSSEGGVADLKEAASIADKIGYPVMIKATGGGGGRGIRVCSDRAMLAEEFMIAKAEAKAACGNDEVYIEKCVVDPRHIEFQILGDHTGKIIHLGERECSVQRRFQKLIEEAPSPALDDTMRSQMGEMAIKAAKAVNYTNAGTVEFLLDQAGNFYFIEINSRIQVEHPVTEMVTGVDLVKQQIQIANGTALDFDYESLSIRGWAIECRINAENPDFNFMPCPGTIEHYRAPAGFGVRFETQLYQGYSLPIYYDSMIGKLIAFDLTREGAIKIMRRALNEICIDPLKSTISLHARIMEDTDFINGDIHTGYIKKFVPDEDEDEDDDD